MLKSWSIQNFKPIIDSGKLKLAPVTVLAGKNSSGKSSLIQSILMIAQTLSNQIPDRALLPNERIVQLGTFEDILNANSGSRTLKLSFELEIEQESQRLLARQRAVSPRLDVRLAKVSVTFNTLNGSNGASSSAVEAAYMTTESVVMELACEFSPLIEGRETEIVLDKQEEPKPKVSLVIQKITTAELNQFLKGVDPDSLRLVPYNDKQSHYWGFFTPDERENASRSLVALSHFLPTRFVDKGVEGLKIIVDEPNIETSNQAVEQITRFFSSRIRYLSPLRADASTIQRNFAPTSELDEVGAKGEYSAVVYHYNQLAHIDWYNPQTKQVEQGTLQKALDAWAQYFDIAYQVRTEIAGFGGVMWKVVIREGQQARTLPEIGGGVSHVLPILVMGLLAPIHTLLIIEEPEVTLHASVQARLGDFFVGLSKCQKQCLVETHSENLVSQLRYHIVQAGGQDKSDCIVYFVSQDEQGASKFEPIEISAQGNILNWPDGFFDETMLQEDRITAASIKKRATKAKHG